MELLLTVVSALAGVAQVVLSSLQLRAMRVAEPHRAADPALVGAPKRRRNARTARDWRRLALDVSVAGGVVLILTAALYGIAEHHADVDAAAEEYTRYDDDGFAYLAQLGAVVTIGIGLVCWGMARRAETLRAVWAGATLVVLGGLLLLATTQLETIS